MQEGAVASVKESSVAKAAGPAKFAWYDLMTSDIEAAASFYENVIGWATQDNGMAGAEHYRIFSMGPKTVSGLMALPEKDLRPSWMGYIGVDDVDAYARRVVEAGGGVHVPPRDIPGVGRFSLVADPQGAVFYLFHPNGSAQLDDTPAAPGRICWHELNASNLDSAYAFYAGLFGWERGGSHDMGARGLYQMFTRGGAPLGGMMKAPPSMPEPFWLYYFSVESVAAAAKRVTEAGGKVVHGPAEVPGGWIAQCLDPQGALFGVAAMES
jgi:predicted enzyme related to lactoylglutathione lyase